jgi:hypothetical protein
VGVFVETIKLDDQVSGTAKKVGGALADAGKAMGGLSKSTFDAANAMAVGKASIGAAVDGIKSAFTSLASGDVKGAIQGVTDSVAGMAKLLDLAVPGLGQAAAVVIQIAGGLVGITAGLIKAGVEFAISSSESKQAMLGLFDAMGGGVSTGLEMEAVIDGLKDKFGISKDSMIGYTNELQRMGMTNLDEIRDSLLAVASAGALVKGGDEALLSFMKKIEIAKESGTGLKIATKQLASLGATGANVGDVAKVMGVSVESLTASLKAGTVDAAKFGDALQEAIINKGKGPLERMAASSANLKKLFSESMGDLFEDIDVAPFMQEVKKLFDIFSQGTESGKSLKAGIGGFFKEVFEVLTKVVPLAKHFLLDMVIYGLKAYIAIKPIAKAISEFASSATGAAMITQVLSSLWTILKVIGVVVVAVAAVMLVMWAAMVVVSTTVWTLVGALISLWVDGFEKGITSLSVVGAAIAGFAAEAWAVLTGWVGGAATAAADFVAGLVAGISAGAGAVVGAVKGLADGAAGAFKSALGIKSPSTVMAGFGEHMGGGVVQGLEASESSVHGASSGVADAAVKGMAAGGADAGGGATAKGGGAPVTVYVTIDGAGKEALAITQEMVQSVFETMALQAGV